MDTRWTALKPAPTKDVSAIKRVYAEKARENLEGFCGSVRPINRHRSAPRAKRKPCPQAGGRGQAPDKRPRRHRRGAQSLRGPPGGQVNLYGRGGEEGLKDSFLGKVTPPRSTTCPPCGMPWTCC